MIANIFTELTTIATAFITFLTGLFTSVVEIIYTTGTTPGFTIVGQLMLMGLATGLVMWALYFIRSLIRVRRG